MKYLVFNPYPLDNNSFVVLIEQVHKLLEEDNNEIYLLTCSGTLKPCDSNYESSNIRCLECNFTKNIASSSLRNNRRIHFLNIKDFHKKNDYYKSLSFDYLNIDQLKELKYNNINIGLGVVSSYVSMTRNLYPNVLNVDVKCFFDALLKSAAIVVDAVEKITNSHRIECFIFFNGRYSCDRPLFEYAKVHDIISKSYECTFSNSREKQKIVSFENSMPHDFEANTIIINNYWDSSDDNKILKANDFFVKRKLSLMASDKIHTINQDLNKLPSDWDDSKRNFVIFNSSEDEFYCIGDVFDKYKMFKNQVEGILFIVKLLQSNNNIHIYLRVHPNLSDVNYKYHLDLYTIFSKCDNISIIPAKSNVSTYKLIDNCEKVIVFGSTVGVEASYWGKPVILIGGSFYYHLNTTYNPSNFDELFKMLNDNLLPKSKLGALKYALYIYGERGENARYVNVNFTKLSFFNKQLLVPFEYKIMGSNKLYLLFNVIFRLLNIIHHVCFKKVKLKRISIEY